MAALNLQHGGDPGDSTHPTTPSVCARHVILCYQSLMQGQMRERKQEEPKRKKMNNTEQEIRNNKRRQSSQTAASTSAKCMPKVQSSFHHCDYLKYIQIS